MFKIIAKITGVLLLVGYMIFAGVIYNIGKEPPRYRGVEIVIRDSCENHFVEVEDIKQILRQSQINPIGKPYKDFDTYEVAERLKQNKLIKHADCYHTPDSLLRIDIYQRRPIMRVRNVGGGDYYIDTDGEIMPVQTGIALHLPLATGKISKQLAQNGLYEFALFLQNNKFWRSEIVQINVNDKDEVELIPRIGQHIILIGSFNNFEEKLENLKTFYSAALNKKGWNSYKVINLKFKDQVIGEKK